MKVEKGLLEVREMDVINKFLSFYLMTLVSFYLYY